MIKIDVKDRFNSFIEKYSSKLDLGGFSNLAKSDLEKSSRRSYQITGLYGEAAFFDWRYKSIDKLISNLDGKLKHYYSTGEGDAGRDDILHYNGKTRFVDIKTSHVLSEEKIQYLNLVIPEREMHKNMVYISAFSVGLDRENVNHVILAGWVFNEEINKRWKYDSTKFAVPVKELRPMDELKTYL